MLSHQYHFVSLKPCDDVRLINWSSIINQRTKQPLNINVFPHHPSVNTSMDPKKTQVLAQRVKRRNMSFNIHVPENVVNVSG